MSGAIGLAGLVATAIAAVPSDAKAAITFTNPVRGYDPTTGDSTSTPASVSGYASQVPGKPDRYKALGLIEETSPTLFFVPDTSGQQPTQGDECTWAGVPRRVVEVFPVAPAGVSLACEVIVQ